MRLHVDRDSCCSSGVCVLTAPGIFDQDASDGRVLLLVPTPAADRHAEAREAIEACPCGAITED